MLAAEAASHAVLPPAAATFRALELTPCASVRVVLLGQDPYHGPGQAHGLAFSVPPGIRPPPSLRNIFKELASDLDIAPPTHGSLEAWARQGVLLLNTALTVRAGAPGSHGGHGWERFTDAVLGAVAAQPARVVFVLWGAHAQRKRALVEQAPHAVLAAPHPSPLSAYRGFLGSRPFSRVNDLLTKVGRDPLAWALE